MRSSISTSRISFPESDIMRGTFLLNEVLVNFGLIRARRRANVATDCNIIQSNKFWDENFNFFAIESKKSKNNLSDV